MTTYISRKSDSTSKPATIGLVPNQWNVIEVANLKNIIPTESSKAGAEWGAYLNVETPKIGGASELVLCWARDYGTKKDDRTGYESKPLNKGGTTYVKDVWEFQAIKGQPVTLLVKPNGKATISTREVKLAIKVVK